MPTPADKNYVNQSRETQYIAALQQAATEVQSLRALLTAVLVENGPQTLTQALMDETPTYEVTLRSEDDTYYIEAVKAEPTEETNDDDH